MHFKLIVLTTLSIVASIVMASPALSSNKQGLARCDDNRPFRLCCPSPDQHVGLACEEWNPDTSEDSDWYEPVPVWLYILFSSDTIICCGEYYEFKREGDDCVRPAKN
ncbi:hypothetical protein BJ165DRAFT_1406535 [Panaeolus papilionaceus]|nr:hypothetical protein BJ165DRAFT_1406535 [Panaeolus papilionaceus]